MTNLKVKPLEIGNLQVKTLEVSGLYPAIYGMRNPLNSHDLMDTIKDSSMKTYIGEKDMNLCQRLIRAGGEHRKFLRQIQVWANITVPRYLWQELDTYKFGTKNSESTMHTIHKRPFKMNDFYIGTDPIIMTYLHLENNVIPTLNKLRNLYFETNDYSWIIEMKRILPESFIQTRTWNTNYEELRNIYFQRKSHRLKEEWGLIIKWIESLPYSRELILHNSKE